jgi:hypothetical protein
MFYKEFIIKCDCKKRKDLIWDKISNFYFCDECNKIFSEDDINNPL